MKKLFLLLLLFNNSIVNSQNKKLEYEYDQEKLNSSGQRDGELVHTSYDEKVEYKHLYKNGKLVEATNYRYFIEGNRTLVGKYKDENPFDGYFVSINTLEIPVIDYYTNGTLTAQYNCSLLDLINSEGQEFNLKFTKTNFKNNKPDNGLIHKDEFRLGEAHLLVSEYYKDGKITNADFWIMAIHYAELIKFKFLSNGYILYKESLLNIEDEAIDNKNRSITVEFKDSKTGTVSFEVENKLITKYNFHYSDIDQKIMPFAGFITYFFYNDNTVIMAQNYNLETNKELYNDAYRYNSNLISQAFLTMNNQPIPFFSNEGDNDYSQLLELNKDIQMRSVLYLDEKGNPLRGFSIEKDNQEKYKFTHYEDSKIISQKGSLPLESLKESISTIHH